MVASSQFSSAFFRRVLGQLLSHADLVPRACLCRAGAGGSLGGNGQVCAFATHRAGKAQAENTVDVIE